MSDPASGQNTAPVCPRRLGACRPPAHWRDPFVCSSPQALAAPPCRSPPGTPPETVPRPPRLPLVPQAGRSSCRPRPACPACRAAQAARPPPWGGLEERPRPASVRRPRLLAAPSGRGGMPPAVSRQVAARAQKAQGRAVGAAAVLAEGGRGVPGPLWATPPGRPQAEPPEPPACSRGRQAQERQRRALGRGGQFTAAGQPRPPGAPTPRPPGRQHAARSHAGRPLQGVPPPRRPQGNDVPTSTTSPGQRRAQGNDVPRPTVCPGQRRAHLHDVPRATTCPGQRLPRPTTPQANDSPGQRLPRPTTCPPPRRAQGNRVPRATVCPPQSRVAGEAAGGRAGQWAGDAWRVRRPLLVVFSSSNALAARSHGGLRRAASTRPGGAGGVSFLYLLYLLYLFPTPF